MRHASKGLIAAAAAALIASGGAALAQAPGGPNGPGPHREMGEHHDRGDHDRGDRDRGDRDRGDRDRGDRHGGMFRHDEHFPRYLDTNGDHKLSLSEIEAEEDRIVALADVNGDGTLSRDEFRRRGWAMLMRLRTFSVFDLLDANGDGKVTLAEVEAPSERWFAHYDTNKDGALEASELTTGFGGRAPPHEVNGRPGPNPQAERFIRFLDTNHDGKVSLNEIKGEETRIFKFIDRNNDGVLDPEEFRRGGMMLVRLRAATLFDVLDANGDDKLTKAEIHAPSERWFARYDANKDGFLDPYELRQSMGPRDRR